MRASYYHINAWREKILLLTLVFYIAVPACATAREQNIHALRSAYLFYFSSLIEWPSSTSFEKNELSLCVLTDDEEERYQLSTIDRKTSGDHVLRIHLINDLNAPDAVNTCHMFYLNGNHLGGGSSNFAADTLLITEGKVSHRGLIHLFTENNKLMFEIDIDALAEKDFKASSKLLRLSRKEAK